MEKLQSYIPLNFSLLANPVNWAIIVLMVAIAMFAVSFIIARPNISIEE